MAEIGRLLTAMVTPFNDMGEVDYEQAKKLAHALLDSGSDGVVVSGTTGESPTLTTDEKMRLFGEIKESVGNKGVVIAGTGTYNTAESIELSQEAEKQGVDGLLLVVPYYNKPPQEGMYQHFKSIAGKTNLPCIVYNIVGRTGVNMTDDTTIRLSQIDNIVGTKEASGDMNQIARIIDGASPGFKVWSGDDNQTFLMMSIGGYGVVSVLSHLVGNQIKHMMGLLLEGDVEGAASEHRRLLPIFLGMFTESNPIPVKYAVNRVGLQVGEPRLPMIPPSEKAMALIDDLLDRYEIDLPVSA